MSLSVVRLCSFIHEVVIGCFVSYKKKTCLGEGLVPLTAWASDSIVMMLLSMLGLK